MRNKLKSAGKAVKILLCVIAVLVVTGIVAGVLFVNSKLNQINRVEPEQESLSEEEIEQILFETDPPDEEFVGEVLNPEDVTMPEEPAEQIVMEDTVVNILLIGQDRRPGQKRQRSDAMILCTVNTETKTLTMTSFLRDTYVKLPTFNGKKYSSNRLNVPYAIGGFEMLDECLMLNFGVEVNHNVEVDFSGFQNVVDAMGGVDIELTRSEARHLGGGLKEGMNHLTGEQALAYSRIRKLDNDFGRTNRQRKVLSALLEQVKHLGLAELLELADTIFPMITTDMENKDIVKYVTDFFPLLSELQIVTQSVPADGEYRGASIHGMSVLVPDMEKINEKLKTTLGS